jgi:hypothetical protein
MSFSHTITQNWSGDGRGLAASTAYSGDGQESREVAVPHPTTDQEVAFVLDVSEIEAIYMVSDQDLTVETNNGSSPVDTISLVAGVPYVWTAKSYHTCLLTTDVTALFLTNNSGAEATFKLEVVYDSTPE